MEIWIAKDKCGNVWSYEGKPTLNEKISEFEGTLFAGVCLDSLFPNLTFNNSPQKVKLILTENG